MIPHSQTDCQIENVTLYNTNEQDWQQELSRSQISVEDLLDQLKLSPKQARGFLASHKVPRNFPLRATQHYIRQIKKGDPGDPLLLQILPTVDELLDKPGFIDDPLDEAAYTPVPGIVHKYHGRALFVVTQACAIHCRYCFRRHFPYSANTGRQHWEAALDYLRGDNSIREVILSGGDPLSVNDRQLDQLLDELAAIGHIRQLRIHSRLPTVLPSRVTARLLAILQRWPGQTVLVTHCNHPNELSEQVAGALGRLRAAGIHLLNQSVLLRGVNDSASCLAELSEKLFAGGVLPYYLHQLDPVAGAGHFAVSEEHALEIHSNVSAHLPGYLVPRLVRELPGAPAKTALPARQASLADT